MTLNMELSSSSVINQFALQSSSSVRWNLEAQLTIAKHCCAEASLSFQDSANGVAIQFSNLEPQNQRGQRATSAADGGVALRSCEASLPASPDDSRAVARQPDDTAAQTPFRRLSGQSGMYCRETPARRRAMPLTLYAAPKPFEYVILLQLSSVAITAGVAGRLSRGGAPHR